MDLGGHKARGGYGNENLSESLTRKFEDLEKKVKKMLDVERKRREKQEAEHYKSLQKKLVTMETGINRLLEVVTGITQAPEERNSRIETQFGKLEAQQTRIMERINAEKGRREEVGGPERNSSIKYILPQFQENTSSIEYMNQLKHYWVAVKPKDSDTHYLLERSQGVPPGDWCEIIKDEVRDFQTFFHGFSRRYWNKQAQHELRKKLEFGSHQGGRMGSRTEYIIRLYTEAKELRPIMSANEIIQKLARHYDDDIKYAIIARGIANINSLVELLENFDRIGSINMNKEETRKMTTQDRMYNNRQTNRSQDNPSWKKQPRGNFPCKTEHPQPRNSSPWQRKPHGHYRNQMERNLENTGHNGRSVENRSWRNNPSSTYHIRNMEVKEMMPEENPEEQIVTSRVGKLVPATSIENKEDQQKDVASEIVIHTNVLQPAREELLEKSEETSIRKRSTCYVANIPIGGILTAALIDTEAEVTCVSEEFVNKNKRVLQECPTLPMNGVTLVGPIGGKAIRLNRQIYADILLPNHMIQVAFLVVPKLSRPCIIGIDLLDEFRCHIDLDSKTISFPHLEGKPSIRIINEENTTT